jgi:predicted O-linked N-acetylglucosamine transferase (SPINDLY family)
MPSAPNLQTALQLSREGKHAAAERVCRQILSVNPSDALVWCHLGTTALAANRLDEAVHAYQQAVRHRPSFPEALNNLAVTLMRQNRVDEALEAFNRAAEVKPGWAEPFISLANYYTTNDRSDDAIAALGRAVRAEPGNPEVHNLLGSALGRIGMIAPAMRHFLEAVRLNPRFAVAHSNLLMLLNYEPQVTPSQLLTEHRWWERLHGPGLSPIPPHPNSREPNRPLRVGYVSPDFRRHVVPSFILPILQAHDRSQIEPFGYAQIAQGDDMTERIRANCSQWRVTTGRNIAQVFDMIRADRIDILVDLAGHTGANRLDVFARHAAPIQISYLGYPNTTGLSAMDYRLTDAVCDPPDQASYTSEKLVRLPGTWCCYQPPENAPAVNPLPALERGWVTFGCMHKLPKLNDMMLDLWSKVLGAVPNSRLLIFRNTVDASIRQRLLDSFAARGVDSQRIEIGGSTAKNAAHLPVYHRIDLALDALPWSGHGTTCESLWMGVPMLSLRGDRHAGRMSASILQAVGLSEWIAETPEQYIAIAQHAANDLPRLAALRDGLRARMQASRLCNAQGFTRELEAVYRSLWTQWCEAAP